MENKDIIYNNTNDLIMPTDTSARVEAFEADAAKKRRETEEHDRVMNTSIDTSANNIALKAELERAKRVIEEQQAMYQDIEKQHKHK